MIPVIILNWNGLEDTIECVTSVLQLQDVLFQIFLVDNGSEMIERNELIKRYSESPFIEIVQNDQNKGFVRANNHVISRLLRNENIKYIALLNNDTVVSPYWLKELVDFAELNKAEMVSSKLINYYDRSLMDNSGHFMLNTAEILAEGHFEPVTKYNDAKRNLGPCAGAALYSVKMIKKIGLFDTFFNTGYEDAEYGLRATLFGYRSFYNPRAIVYHKVSQSINKMDYDEYFQKTQRNILYTFFKLMPGRHIAFNLPWIILKYLLLTLLDIVLLRFHNLRLHFGAIYSFLVYDLKIALENRTKIFGQLKEELNIYSRVSPFIKFFLLTDLYRLCFLFFAPKLK